MSLKQVYNIEVNKQYSANLFYWCFESMNSPTTDPFIIWLTGGPGCSSMLALLFENGPYTVSNITNKLVPNPYGWNNNATVCWVDQPTNTGFSYAKVDYIHNEAGVATEMWAFFGAFFAQYPQYQTLDFYLSGESYGGHYVPAITAYVAKQQASGQQVVNFKGASVGDGWVAPIVQFGQYGPFAFANNLIDNRVYREMNNTYSKCLKALQGSNYNSYTYNECESIMQYVLNANPGINYYNIKTQCNPPPLCYDFTPITTYLNDASTKKALGVPAHITWNACDSAGNPFVPVDELENYATDIPLALSAGYQILIYSGKLDLICNYFGGAEWLQELQWSGQTGFNNQTLANWKISGSTAGQWKTYNNLTWLEVNNAGHMVPHDQPENSLAMINTFITGGTF